MNTAMDIGAEFARQFGCGGKPDPMDCLRKKPVVAIARMAYRLFKRHGPYTWNPATGGI